MSRSGWSMLACLVDRNYTTMAVADEPPAAASSASTKLPISTATCTALPPPPSAAHGRRQRPRSGSRASSFEFAMQTTHDAIPFSPVARRRRGWCFSRHSKGERRLLEKGSCCASVLGTLLLPLPRCAIIAAGKVQRRGSGTVAGSSPGQTGTQRNFSDWWIGRG